MKDNAKMKIVITMVILLCCVASWATTSAIIFGISRCFSFEFSFKLSTGVWLILFLLRSVFSKNEKS